MAADGPGSSAAALRKCALRARIGVGLCGSGASGGVKNLTTSGRGGASSAGAASPGTSSSDDGRGGYGDTSRGGVPAWALAADTPLAIAGIDACAVLLRRLPPAGPLTEEQLAECNSGLHYSIHKR